MHPAPSKMAANDALRVRASCRATHTACGGKKMPGANLASKFLLTDFVEKRRLRQPRADHVDADVVPRVLARQRFRERYYGRLRSGINGLAHGAHPCRVRTKIRASKSACSDGGHCGV